MSPTLDAGGQLFNELTGNGEQMRLFEAVLVTVAIGGTFLSRSFVLAPVMALTPAAFAAYWSRCPGI